MTACIVHSSAPVALLGGAKLGPEVLNILPTCATTYVAADGGAEHLAAMGVTPAAIIGDMDSISDELREKWGDIAHYVDDPNTTDFEKSLAQINAPLILAAGFLGGRLDHTCAVLNHLSRKRLYNVVLISDDDVCFLARDSATTLTLPLGTRVGLLPLSAARVGTIGLKWEISDAAMEFAGFISTSNETAQPELRIHALGSLLITLPLSALAAVIDVVRAG